MHFKRILFVVAAVAAIGTAQLCAAAAGGEIVKADPSKHFDSKGNAPSKFTIDL